MPGSRSSNNDTEHNKSPRESGEDSEDESEILEESPCGRWLKRKEEVSTKGCLLYSKFETTGFLGLLERIPMALNFFRRRMFLRHIVGIYL